MAAKTAGEAGLKVILVERKRDITQLNRLCGQFTNISLINVSGRLKYGYTKPLGLDISTGGTRITWPEFGFSLDYEGPLRPYLNYAYVSPSGNRVYRVKNRLFGFFTEKEWLLSSLLKGALKAGVEVMTETVSLGAENKSTGVTVRVRTGDGAEQEIEASRALAADGKESAIVESLGLNKNRKVLSTALSRLAGYVVEGVDCDLKFNTWVNITFPSLNNRGNFWMYMLAGDQNIIGGAASADRSATQNVDALMASPAFRPWFHKIKLVRKIAVASAAPVYSPLMTPYLGNVLAIGDAACLVEVTNPGAVACGYLGAKSTIKEMEGKSGYPEYADWWMKSFDTNDPDYLKSAGRNFAVNAVCDDQAIDYLYQLVGEKAGLPAVMIAQNMETIKKERPAIFQKLHEAGVGLDVSSQQLDLAAILQGKNKTG
jgi:flavin-dependent dehydrogenase